MSDVLSSGIANLITTLETHENGPSAVAYARLFPTLIASLRIMRRMALSMEQELSVHRLGEANAIGRGHAERLSSEALTHLVLDPEGKVVKPDFGRRS
jgi:hypothetical protein